MLVLGNIWIYSRFLSLQQRPSCEQYKEDKKKFRAQIESADESISRTKCVWLRAKASGLQLASSFYENGSRNVNSLDNWCYGMNKERYMQWFYTDSTMSSIATNWDH